MSVFIKKGNQWVVTNEGIVNGSTNDHLQALGYDTNQFYSYINFDQPYDYDNGTDSIMSVCLKVMTEDIICVITNPGRSSLSDAEVRHYMKDFVFSDEYSTYSLESDLDSAIAAHNYSIEFVGDALGIPYSHDDTMLYSSRFKYNFYFEGGYLVDYETADGFNREARDLENSGSWIYETIETHARNYHGSNDDAILNEINIQAKAFYCLPSGIKNEYLPEFKNADGSYNFKMILVAKYQGTEYENGITYEECKCVCHNELKFEGNVEEGLDKLVKYRYRNYILTFDDKGSYKSCEYSRSPSKIVNSIANKNSGQSSGSGCMVSILSALLVMMMFIAAIIIVL